MRLIHFSTLRFNDFCLADIILYVRTEGQDHGDVAIPIAVAAHLVASCDILSATYDGLGGKVAPFAAKNHVPSLLYNILTDEVFNEVVSHQIVSKHFACESMNCEHGRSCTLIYV